jgi:hypothetical protein
MKALIIMYMIISMSLAPLFTIALVTGKIAFRED